MICGRVKNGVYCDGRRIIADKTISQLLSEDSKRLPDNTKLLKIESSYRNYDNGGFFKDGIKLCDVISRFDLKEVDPKSLSLSSWTPISCRVHENNYGLYFGEQANNRAKGRGIRIYHSGIEIGFHDKGEL